MKYHEKEYVIAKQGDSKYFLAQVKTVDDKVFTIIPEKNRHLDPREIEISKKDIVLNLGLNPAPGNVYGVDVSNRYKKALSHEFWGTLYFFIDLPKDTLKVLRTSLDHTAKVLGKLGLEDFTDVFSIEVRAKKGKYAGLYKHSKDESVLNTIVLSPDWEQTTATSLVDYILYHEFGHVLRYNGLTSKKAQARWLKLFHKSIKPDLIDHKDLMAILKGLKAAKKEDDAIGWSEAMKGLADEDEEMAHRAKILMRWFKQIHHLSSKDLSTMWAAEDIEQIEGLWPAVSIDSSKLDPLVSEYACVSSEELFAESFACYAQKKKLPNSVETLMDKSLSLIKANKPVA
jgi:hypothetical protein